MEEVFKSINYIALYYGPKFLKEERLKTIRTRYLVRIYRMDSHLYVILNDWSDQDLILSNCKSAQHLRNLTASFGCKSNYHLTLKWLRRMAQISSSPLTALPATFSKALILLFHLHNIVGLWKKQVLASCALSHCTLDFYFHIISCIWRFLWNADRWDKNSMCFSCVNPSCCTCNACRSWILAVMAAPFRNILSTFVLFHYLTFFDIGYQFR